MPSNDIHRPTSRVLDILELLAANQNGMTLTEIAEAISSPKSTILPIIRTMSNRKFLMFDNTSGKYFIGINTFCVGQSYTQSDTVLQFITEEMNTIVSLTGEICQMGILDNNEVLYVAKVDCKEAIQLASYVGKRLPAYSTAIGKCLLCNFDIEYIKSLYPNGLKAYTKHTITSFEVLEKQLKEIQATHIANENEEITDHICCIATPLESKGAICAALSVSMPTFRYSEEKKALIEEALLMSKKKIEVYLDKYNMGYII